MHFLQVHHYSLVAMCSLRSSHHWKLYSMRIADGYFDLIQRHKDLFAFIAIKSNSEISSFKFFLVENASVIIEIFAPLSEIGLVRVLIAFKMAKDLVLFSSLVVHELLLHQ